jgi:hypothetical protein
MVEQPAIQRLSARKVFSIFRQPGWFFAADLTAQLDEDPDLCIVYKNSDGRVLELLSIYDRGNLYESVNDWLTEKRYIESLKNQSPTSILKGRFPTGQHFIEQVPELINELAAQLGIPLEQLDGTEESLKVIDRAVQRLKRLKQFDSDRIFAPATAYFGEMIRRKDSRRRWEMLPTEDPEIWEPLIVGPQEYRYQPCIPVYDELYEEIRCCLYGVFLG